MSSIYRSALAVSAIAACASAQQALWLEDFVGLNSEHGHRSMQPVPCMAFDYGPNANSA